MFTVQLFILFLFIYIYIGFQSIIEALPSPAKKHLITLNIYFNYTLTDELVRKLISILPNLRVLNIGKCIKLTSKSLEHLSESRLTHLSVLLYIPSIFLLLYYSSIYLPIYLAIYLYIYMIRSIPSRPSRLSLKEISFIYIYILSI